jgi:hypothetical protein
MNEEISAHKEAMAQTTEEATTKAKEILADAKESATEMVNEAKAKTATEVANRKAEIKLLDDELEFNKKRTSRLFAESVAADENEVVNNLLAKHDLVTMSSDEKTAFENQAQTIKTACDKEKAVAINSATSILKHKQELDTRDLKSDYEKQITALETVEASKNAEIARLENQINDFKTQQESDNKIRLAEANNASVTINQDSSSNKR